MMSSTKPKFLYHASQNTNITCFEPRAESIRDPKEGPVVFATPDKAYASMFIVPCDDSWTSKGRYNGQYYTLISDKKRFKNIDKGGAIYTISSSKFTNDPKRPMGDKEWISKTPVTPIKKEVYKSGLTAMKELKVNIIFTDVKTFKEFRILLSGGQPDEVFALFPKAAK